MNRIAPGAAVVAACLAGLLAAGTCRAASEQVPVGPRALALGGAFSAVADDASAMFWNPAGLTQIGQWDLSGSTAKLYGIDLKENRLSFVLPIPRRHALAIEWDHSSFDDGELEFGEDRFALAYGLRILPQWSVGVTGKLFTRSTGLDGVQLGRGSGLGVDVGTLIQPMRGLRRGLVAQDLLDTELRYDAGGTAVIYPRNVRFGAAYTRPRLGTVAFDVDDRWHVGIEGVPDERLAVRLGAQRDRERAEGTTWSAGAGVKLSAFRFDYAYVAPPDLASTSHFGMSVAFTPSPSLLRFESVQPAVLEIFPALGARYAIEETAPATTIVTNTSDRPVTGTLSVFLDGLMDVPDEHTVTIAPGEATRLPLNVTLSPKAQQVTRHREVRLDLTMSYESGRIRRKDHLRQSATAYGAGYIDWNMGLDVAAAFVTPLDPPVNAIGIDVGRWASDRSRWPLESRSLALCAAAVEALGSLGVRYVPDPDNPYSKVDERSRAVDRISYPRQTLADRRGDCDDMTVLLASVLANVGVRTRFVDKPGHIFLLAETDLSAIREKQVPLPEGRLIAVEDHLWIPLEATALDSGFAVAWRSGAEQFSGLDRSDPNLLADVFTGMVRYPSSEPIGPAAAPVLPPDLLDRRTAASLDVVRGWIAADLQQRQRELDEGGEDSGPGAAGWNTVARIEFGARGFPHARRSLENGLRAEPGSLALRTNLASVLACEGDLRGAARELTAILAADPGSVVSWLNLAIVHAAAGDSVRAVSILGEAARRGGGARSIAELLATTPGHERADPVAEARMTRLVERATRTPRAGLVALDPRTIPEPRGARASRGDTGAGVEAVFDLLPFLAWREGQ
jgi:hypothetical protein